MKNPESPIFALSVHEWEDAAGISRRELPHAMQTQPIAQLGQA
jgi:hypothetical protein